jgi:hypothetical protein
VSLATLQALSVSGNPLRATCSKTLGRICLWVEQTRHDERTTEYTTSLGAASRKLVLLTAYFFVLPSSQGPGAQKAGRKESCRLYTGRRVDDHRWKQRDNPQAQEGRRWAGNRYYVAVFRTNRSVSLGTACLWEFAGVCGTDGITSIAKSLWDQTEHLLPIVVIHFCFVTRAIPAWTLLELGELGCRLVMVVVPSRKPHLSEDQRQLVRLRNSAHVRDRKSSRAVLSGAIQAVLA